jgi:hypothetical protein
MPNNAEILDALVELLEWTVQKEENPHYAGIHKARVTTKVREVLIANGITEIAHPSMKMGRKISLV